MDPEVIDGKYEIVRQLGQGGMGAVYEAKNRETGRRVAVKVIVSELVAKNPEAISRFKREAKTTGAIDTPHVAQVLDAGRHPTTGDPYMVMELLSGEDLKQLIRRIGPVDPDVALRIAAQACTGLLAAHARGIIHRDIKSANLYLAHREGGGDVVVKIVDFGIAKIVAEHAAGGDTTDLTRTGAVLGSPRYMSPEQARGQGGVGPASDLWSLGIVLYELLTGTTPHADIEGTYGLIIAICSTPPQPVCELAPWVSPTCAEIVQKALQLDPKNRFASATEMLSALRAALPHGTSLTQSMLVPLPAELRAMAKVSPATIREGGKDGATAEGVARSRESARAPAARSLRLPAIALSLLVGGGLAFWLLRPSAPVAPAARPPMTAPEPAATPPPAPAVESRTVRLGVDPADATIEIDGRATPVIDGAVDVVGPIGSVHRVRIARGAEEAILEVAITTMGAVPPKAQLAATGPKAPVKPRATTAEIAHPPANGPPTSKPKQAPPATKFE